MSFLDFFRAGRPGPRASDEGANLRESLDEVRERLRRIENGQKETSLQLEEIDEFLRDGGGEGALVEAAIALSDTIEDFYHFASADPGSALFDQARMMRAKARGAARSAGIEAIDPAGEPFDFRLHSAEIAERDPDAPEGHVLRTLKCGYIYKEQIARRAAVAVNKIGAREDWE